MYTFIHEFKVYISLAHVSQPWFRVRTPKVPKNLNYVFNNILHNVPIIKDRL